MSEKTTSVEEKMHEVINAIPRQRLFDAHFVIEQLFHKYPAEY